MFDKGIDAGVYFEIDCIGNVRRLRGGARYGAGAPLPSDLGGYKYTAFGRTLAADAGTPAPVVDGVGFGQALRWQGRWLDEPTGLYDFRNRVWSPDLAAFLSPDEFGYVTTEGTLWSWPNQNPVAIRDPMGRGELQNYLDAASDIPIIGFLFAGPSAFGHGVQNRVEGTLKLSNDATVEEGLAQRAKGNCQISIGAMASGATADVVVGAINAAPGLIKAGAAAGMRFNLLLKGGLHGHHPLPVFLGGRFNQTLIHIPASTHSAFHSALATSLAERGLLAANASAREWATFMANNPGAQRSAFDAVLQASRSIDRQYGTRLTQATWNSIMEDAFTPY